MSKELEQGAAYELTVEGQDEPAKAIILDPTVVPYPPENEKPTHVSARVARGDDFYDEMVPVADIKGAWTGEKAGKAPAEAPAKKA